jgi:hypothetical protein
MVATLALCLALYARALGGAFVIDDRTFFVENDDLTTLPLSEAATVFTRPTNAWGDFQPLRDLLFLAEFRAFGRNPVGYHAVSILLYAATCALAWRLVRALGARGEGAGLREERWSSLVVAAIFATHPAHVEAVAYICGQKELLSAAFSLSALLAFLRGFEGEARRVAWLAGGILAYGAAILSKQTAIMLAPLVPLLWLLSDRNRRPAWPPALAAWVAVNVPALLWLARSREAFQALWGATSELTSVPMLERLPLALKIVGAHARLAVWPFSLSFGYPFDGSARPDSKLGAGILALFVLGVAGWVWRRERLVLFGAVAFVAFLVPVMQLHGSLNNASIYDRYLFLPILGLAVLVERVARASAERAGWPSIVHSAVVGAAIVAGVVGTVGYAPAFADDVAVTRNTFARHPDWSRASFELGYSLVEAGRTGEARALMARARGFDSPAWVRPYLEGWAALEDGDTGGAIATLTVATALADEGGYYPFPAIPLARGLIRVGRLEEAEWRLQRALAFPLYQPLETHHARKLLEEVARRRAAGG